MLCCVVTEFARPVVVVCSAGPISYFEVLNHVGGMAVLWLWVGLLITFVLCLLM